MYMIFVDESGDPGYPNDGDWNRWGGTRVYVRVGAVIHGWKWKAWNKRMEQIKRNRGLGWDSELKASHIRRGKGAFVGWDEPRRKWFMKEVLQLIGANLDITLLGVVIDKTRVDTRMRDRIVKPEIRSMEHLLERYNLFLNHQRDKSGIVVLDTVHGVNDDNIRHFQSYLQAHSEHLRPLRIVEGTFFAKSHTSNMVQVADICSNFLYRNEVGAAGGQREFRYIYPRFWRYKRKVQGYGIEFQLSKRVGGDLTLADLQREFDVVLLCPGEAREKRLGLRGEQLEGVFYWNRFLKRFNGSSKRFKGKKAVIIGGGDTAMDCARVAVRLGLDATVAYRKTQEFMPCQEKEREEAEKEGVKFVFLLSPTKFLGEEKVEKVRFQKAKIENEQFVATQETIELDADFVVVAIGQQQDNSVLHGTELQGKWIETKCFSTPLERTFAAGDIVNEKKTVIHSAVSGKKAAEEMERFMVQGK